MADRPLKRRRMHRASMPRTGAVLFTLCVCTLALTLGAEELFAAPSHRPPRQGGPTATFTPPLPPGFIGTPVIHLPTPVPPPTDTPIPTRTPFPTDTPFPSDTPLPPEGTSTPTPPPPTDTATPAAPALTIASAALYHSVNGRLQRTTTLKLGERGWFEVAYRITNAGGLKPTASILVGKGTRALFAGAMPSAVTPDGEPGFAVQGTFRPKKLPGSLYASFVVRLGGLKSVFPLTFTLVKG